MNLIFLGGLSRSGKAAFWPLFSSLENTDQPQNLVDLDWLNDAFKNHLISEEIFLELLRAKINVSSWYSYLGRNLNTNSNDWTNFIRLKSKDEYIARPHAMTLKMYFWNINLLLAIKSLYLFTILKLNLTLDNKK